MDPFRGTTCRGLVPHYCEYCRKIEINYGTSTANQVFRYEKVHEAALYGCDLFRERQRKAHLEQINLNPQSSLEISFQWTNDFQRMNFEWLDDNEIPFLVDNEDW